VPEENSGSSADEYTDYQAQHISRAREMCAAYIFQAFPQWGISFIELILSSEPGQR
jgi:hypothetical protein